MIIIYIVVFYRPIWRHITIGDLPLSELGLPLKIMIMIIMNTIMIMISTVLIISDPGDLLQSELRLRGSFSEANARHRPRGGEGWGGFHYCYQHHRHHHSHRARGVGLHCCLHHSYQHQHHHYSHPARGGISWGDFHSSLFLFTILSIIIHIGKGRVDPRNIWSLSSSLSSLSSSPLSLSSSCSLPSRLQVMHLKLEYRTEDDESCERELERFLHYVSIIWITRWSKWSKDRNDRNLKIINFKARWKHNYFGGSDNITMGYLIWIRIFKTTAKNSCL